MGSRPKRSSRNQNPSYTFKMDTDFVAQDLAIAAVPKKRQRRSSKLLLPLSGDFDESQATSPEDVKLTEERKNDILELLKRDMSQQSTVAQVGNAEHIGKVAGEIGVPPKQLRKWLGITDSLTQVPVSASIAQFREKVLVPMLYIDDEPSEDTLKQPDEGEGNLGGKLHELEEKFQEEKPLLEEELEKLQQEIQHATELIEQFEEKQRLMGSDLTSIPIITEDNVPMLEETSQVADGSNGLMDEERFEFAQAALPDDSMMETEMASIWNLNQAEAVAPIDDLENTWVQEMWDAFMTSNTGTQQASQISDSYENNEVFEDAIGEMEEVEQQQNEDTSAVELKKVPSSQLSDSPSSLPSVCHQSTGPNLDITDLTSVPNPESEPTFDVSNCTTGVICENMTAEIGEETIQSIPSICSAESVEEKPEREKETKSKVLVTRKITDYFKKLSHGKKENNEE